LGMKKHPAKRRPPRRERAMPAGIILDINTPFMKLPLFRFLVKRMTKKAATFVPISSGLGGNWVV
jgi:hypothetical protein